MKIAFDLRALDGASKYRGIGIHLTSLCNELFPLLLKNHDLVIYSYDKKNLKDINKNLIKKCSVIELPAPKSTKLPAKVQMLLAGINNPEYRNINRLPDLSTIDLFFQGYHSYGVPRSVKSVVMAYDLIPLLFKEQYFEKHEFTSNPKSWILIARARLQFYNYNKLLKVFKKATHAIANSESTKNDIAKYARVKEDKISVVYLGPPNTSTKSADDSFISAVPRPYVTYIGGIDGRRDLRGLLTSFQSSLDLLGVDLVLAGRDFENIMDSVVRELVEKGVNSGKVHNIGFISEAQKRTLIENALAVVYPTLYEGFGLPLLEAFEYGCPIISYKNSSIPEVGGEAALYVENAQEMLKKISALKEDSKVRNEYIAKGKKQVKRFSWNKAAKETNSILNKLT